MVDGGFLMALTDLLQNEAVRETVGEHSEKVVDLTHYSQRIHCLSKSKKYRHVKIYLLAGGRDSKIVLLQF